MRRGAAITLILVFLLIETTSVCFAYFYSEKRCFFDRIMQKSDDLLPVATEKDIPRRMENLQNAYAASAEENEIWEPLRIKISTKDLEEGGRQCNNSNLHTRIIDFEGNSYKCEGFSLLKQYDTEHVKPIINKILVQAIKLHTDRLSVKRANGKSIVLPKFTKGVCQYFTVPDRYFDSGFKDADMILFVGAIPIDTAMTTAWAAPCAVNKEGRPVAGAINMFPPSVKFDRHAVRSAAHHIGHALGFWHKMMKGLRMTDQLQVRTKYNHVAIVKTDETKRVVQKHFNCPTALGMELEDGAENNEIQSHWERRNAKDELMSDFNVYATESSVLGLYTELTLAAFHDMGFYKADFKKAEPMTWGKNVGCDFLKKSCFDEKGSLKYLEMFCTREKFKSCTSDRRSTGYCEKQNKDNLIDRWNFNNLMGLSRVGSKETLTDYCPVIFTHGSSCTNNYFRTKPWGGNIIGDDSWCLDGKDLKVKLHGQSRDIGAVCAEVLCVKKEKKFKVKLQGDDDWRECTENGEIDPKTEGTDFISGKVKCPKYDEVCTVNKNGESLVTGDDDLNEEETSDKKDEDYQFIAKELESSLKKAKGNKNEKKFLKQKSSSPLNKILH